VQELWRYTVKSMLGERRELIDLNARGVEGDRTYAIRDATGKFNHGLPPYSVPGFYLPEYAYSREIIPPLQRAGFRFAVMDDAIFGARHGRVPFDTVPQIDDFRVFLRSRRWGDALARGAYDFDRFNREFPQDVNAWLGGQRGYVVLATDAETFGHHHRRHLDWLLKPLVEQWSRPEAPATIVPFADLLAEFGQRACDVSLPPGSWSTEVSDFVSGNHFPLWDSSENLYHQALWRLVNLARGYGDRPAAEDDVLKILSSCCWWQVSGRPNFNPKLMMHGAKKALEVVQRCGDEAAKQAARQAFGQLIRLPGIGD